MFLPPSDPLTAHVVTINATGQVTNQEALLDLYLANGKPSSNVRLLLDPTMTTTTSNPTNNL